MSSVSLQEGRDLGRRDATRAIALAREPDQHPLVKVGRMSPRVTGMPFAGEDGSAARRVGGFWKYMQSTAQGLWYEPPHEDVPLAATLSRGAADAFRDGQIDVYWDAFDLECRRAEVNLFKTYWRPDSDNAYVIRSLYVSDAARFPVFAGRKLPQIVEDGETYFDELWAQEVYRRKLGPIGWMRHRISGRAT